MTLLGCMQGYHWDVKAGLPSGALQGRVLFQGGMVAAWMQFFRMVGLRPWLLAGCQLETSLRLRDHPQFLAKGVSQHGCLFLPSHQEKCLQSKAYIMKLNHRIMFHLHDLCPCLLVRSEFQVLPTLRERGSHKGMGTGWQGLWRRILQSVCHIHLGLIFICEVRMYFVFVFWRTDVPVWFNRWLQGSGYVDIGSQKGVHVPHLKVFPQKLEPTGPWEPWESILGALKHVS